MSDYIKTLSEKAISLIPSGLTTEQWIERYNNVFAELVVGECAQLCDAAGNTVLAMCIRHKFGIV